MEQGFEAALKDCAEAFGLGQISACRPMRAYPRRALSFRVSTDAGDWLLEAFPSEPFVEQYMLYLTGYVTALAREGLALGLRPARSGSPIWPAEAAGNAYRVICRPWLPEGHRGPGQWGGGYLTAVGELLARMHAAGAAWEPPVRHRAWNFGRSASETVAEIARRHGSEISLPAELGAAAARVDEALADPLARTNLHGPVHADCWYGNLLWDGDRLVAADFESCGIGPRAYDLAVWYDAFYGWADAQGRSEQFDQVLAAYERLAPLDPAERAALPYLGALRHFWLLESELEGPAPREQDEPAARRFYVEDHAAAIARLLANAARKP